MPIAELNLSDAIVDLFFLSAPGVKFITQVDDDWYSAHRPAGTIYTADSPNERAPVFSFDRPANVLACASRTQVCNPSTGRCSPLSIAPMGDSIWSSQQQKDIFQYWFSNVATVNPVFDQVVATLGVKALKARDGFVKGLLGSIPPNQWQEELLYWHSISMAALQRITVDMATGGSDPSINKYIKKTSDASGDQSCLPQKARSTAYTSFSVLGLAIIFILGGLIILLATIIEPFCAFLQKKYQRNTYQWLEWVTNNPFQLQRMVHEQIGLGTWNETATDIPVTVSGEPLGILDLSDEKHPVMTRAFTSDTDNESQKQSHRSTVEEQKLLSTQTPAQGTLNEAENAASDPPSTPCSHAQSVRDETEPSPRSAQSAAQGTLKGSQQRDADSPDIANSHAQANLEEARAAPGSAPLESTSHLPRPDSRSLAPGPGEAN